MIWVFARPLVWCRHANGHGHGYGYGDGDDNN